MGRGQFMDTIFEKGQQCLRLICCLICCFFCGGPIMTLIGIVVLTGDNTYDEKLAEYNTAVDEWNKEYESVMKNSSGSVTIALSGSSTESINLRVKEFSMENILKTKDTAIVAATSVQLVSDSSVNMNVARDAVVRAQSNTISTIRVDAIPTTFVDRTNYVCTTLKLSADKQEFSESGLGGCQYMSSGWGNDVVGVNKTTGLGTRVPVRLLSENDPAIALQRITKGTDSFGLTAAEQRKLGIILLVIGLFLCSVCLGVIFCVYRLLKGDEKKNQAMQQAVPIPGIWPTPQPYQVQPQYQQPMMTNAYPTQPAAYPAQPAAYPAQQAAYPAQPAAYPAQPAAYPAQPAAYPAQPAYHAQSAYGQGYA